MKKNPMTIEMVPAIVLALALTLAHPGFAQTQTQNHEQPVDSSNNAQQHEGHESSMKMPAGEESHANHVEGRGPVTLSLGQRQLINLRTTDAERRSAIVKLRTFGVVAYDDTRMENINTKIMGWADVLHVDKPGQYVEKNTPLLDIYSPDLYSAQQEYLNAYAHCAKLDHLLQKGDSGTTGNIQDIVATGQTLLASVKKRLKLWDITEEEILKLEKSGVPSDRLRIRSPVSGYVINKNIDPGQMVRPGMTLYRIADLNTVWINADVYEYELNLFRPGQMATILAKAYPDQEFHATVDFIYPFSELKTRTTTARLVLDNAEGLLKPGMYVDVIIENDLGEQLLIPKEAVFNTGKRQFVFTETEPGSYVPRRIELGSQVDEYIVVTNGLEPGEKIVVDGNFLLDSESQLKAAGSAGGHHH